MNANLKSKQKIETQIKLSMNEEKNENKVNRALKYTERETIEKKRNTSRILNEYE